MINWLDTKSKISSEKIFISKRIEDASLRNFFEQTLTQFHDELQMLADQWYGYDEDGKAGTDEVFALIERSYVGLFNNAVIKSFPKDSVLQEYSVHLGGRKYIFGDYLVKHWEGERSINLLFEAKQRQFNGKAYSKEATELFLNPFIEQGQRYYMAEEKYYNECTYISSLVFEWVRKVKHLKPVLEWNNDEDGVTDFYRFYHSDTAGLMVYGNLKKVK